MDQFIYLVDNPSGLRIRHGCECRMAHIEEINMIMWMEIGLTILLLAVAYVGTKAVEDSLEDKDD